ncbi:MAG: hypothetical protein A2073_08350 [Deltaproteobacteria bacterium GWC2_42_11]|nr:MAG: hypothetical protein A2073_08350 [Deltaproteobacteria bacterium GWC2_42_11]HBO84131.1 dihydroorotate dehydrogenase electron transfer subunit [Deltaproteobacteria bacterium]
MISEVLYNKNVLPSYYKLGLAVGREFDGAVPGQFVMLRISGQLDPFLRRPFGIYKRWDQKIGSPRLDGSKAGALWARSSSKGQKIEILYKVVGKGTGIMSGLKIGDRVDILGPFGNTFPSAERNKNIIMVAGGIGIVPFYLLAKGCKKTWVGLKLLFGGKSKEDLPGLDDFKKLKIDVSVSTDDGSVGEKGMVTKLLLKELLGRDLSSAVVYACGTKPMLKTVADIADRNNIPCYVSLDNVMACGIGACLGCAVKVTGSKVQGVKGYRNNSQLYKMVCKDGPIFDARDIDWEAI